MEFRWTNEQENKGKAIQKAQSYKSILTEWGAFRERDSESFKHKRTIETNTRRDYRNVIKTNAQ